MDENVVDVNVQDGTLAVDSNGSAAPFVVTIEDGVCSVNVLASDGKPIAFLNVINKDKGTLTPVHLSTCAEAVVCKQGIPMEIHLANLYGHAQDAGAHLTAEQKANLETQQGAQAKAIAAQKAAETAASLMIATEKTNILAETSQMVNTCARYTDRKVIPYDNHISDTANPHGVTAEQVGLGNVPNKTTNDLQPTYAEATELSPLSSGERLAVAFGKVAKAIGEFISHLANKANPHGVTASQTGAVPTTGGTMTGTLTMNGGHIVLQRGKNYGSEAPDDLPEGGLFLKVVE